MDNGLSAYRIANVSLYVVKFREMEELMDYLNSLEQSYPMSHLPMMDWNTGFGCETEFNAYRAQLHTGDSNTV